MHTAMMLRGVFDLLKTIWLGLVLIGAAAALLLVSDLDRRQTSDPHAARPLPRIAIMQWTSTDLLDATVAGMVQGLHEEGFEDGGTAVFRFFNASGDSATANLMAREVTGGGYDLVMTASTLALQVVAKANREGRVPHIFAGVTDPYGAGVGIAGPEPHQHPPHLAGVGTFQPVDEAIRAAYAMNPALKRLGVVWNPAEDNSEACLRVARATCAELSIELIEANAGNSSEVPEAIRSVIGRGVDAVWIGGDTVAIASITAIVSASRAAGIPVFSNDPHDVERGVLMGLGASYVQVGRVAGSMGGQVLRGAKPSSFGVANLVPEVLALNEQVADALDLWTISDALRAKAAASLVRTAPVTAPAPGRPYRVGILYFGPHAVFEQAIVGMREELKNRGFIEGRNLTIIATHPNNDLSILPQLIQRMRDQNPDVIVPLSTPVLAALMAAESKLPVVFGVVSAPLDAGAGTSFEQHRPNVTGAVWTAPDPETFVWLKRMFPDVKKVGVIYNAGEANSVRELAVAREQMALHAIKVETRSINNPSEISEVIPSLFSEGIDAVFGMADNTVVSSFPALAQACRLAKIPLVADDGSLMGSGALYSIGASPRGEGRHTGHLVARVLAGERPADIPFSPSRESEVVVDFKAAAELGVTLPETLLKRAVVLHGVKACYGRPARIAVVNLVEARVLELAHAGLLRGLQEAGLKEGEDFTLRDFNAQGEMTQLPALLDAAVNTDPDVIVTITTPVLMAAAQRVRTIPVVYTVASNPTDLELYSPENRPPNLTGVHDDPPVEALLDMALQRNPDLTAVGILYDPAQPNAVISVKKLRKACVARGITLHEVTASTLSDLAVATQAVVQRGAGAILLSADNLVSTGFAVIHQVAQRAGLPIYATSVNLVEEGAAGAIGDDYEAWGAQSARLVAQVLAGVSPMAITPEATRNQVVRDPLPAAAATPPKRTYEIRIVRYNDAQFSADSERGFMEGLRQAGLIDGRDFRVRVLNAQGDMSTLNAILTEVVAARPDLILAISTPALQVALRQAGDLPIVFCSVGDGVRAGGGTSETDHLPNVTGITTKSPFVGMARLIRTAMPWVKTVGTLFSPAEINSELYRGWFEEALAAEGLTLKAVPVNSSAEVAEATTVLLQSKIDVIGQIADNATRPGYAQINKRATEAGLAFLCFDSAGMKDGAALALARDYYANGAEAAELAVRVLRGESPAGIPFTNTRNELLVINPTIMAKAGIQLPEDLKQKAIVYEP